MAIVYHGRVKNAISSVVFQSVPCSREERPLKTEFYLCVLKSREKRGEVVLKEVKKKNNFSDIRKIRPFSVALKKYLCYNDSKYLAL